MARKHMVVAALAVLAVIAAPAGAQGRDVEGELARQIQIAANARAELERLRADVALKDELLVLARQRNAELYAIASEIVALGFTKRSVEPFIQSRRVAMENLKQSFEDRLNAARIFEGTLPPSVQQRMDAELEARRGQDAAPQPNN